MLVRPPACRGEHPDMLCSKSIVHWPTAVEPARESTAWPMDTVLSGRWAANLWFRASIFSYNGNSNHRGDLPRTGLTTG